MKSKTVDRIAIVSALCCAVHCAVLPILFGLTAWAGFAIFENPWIEYGFIITGILLAYFSLSKSLREHRNHSPTKMAIIGVLVLLVSRIELVHEMEGILTVLGALFLVIAHAKNIQVTHTFRKKNLIE